MDIFNKIARVLLANDVIYGNVVEFKYWPIDSKIVELVSIDSKYFFKVFGNRNYCVEYYEQSKFKKLMSRSDVVCGGVVPPPYSYRARIAFP